ncbi:MAG: hypothetical protein JWM99_5039 [Verrucomicrobiales bacterium]|nr:hypothetical protein [Verrucomicrobiales bacterium]
MEAKHDLNFGRLIGRNSRQAKKKSEPESAGLCSTRQHVKSAYFIMVTTGTPPSLHLPVRAKHPEYDI